MDKGYLFVRNFFTNKQASMIKRSADRWQSVPTVKGKWMKYHEYSSDKKKLSRIENFYYHDAELQYLNSEFINPYLNELTNSNMVLFKDKLNFKFPNGKGFKPHQDQHAWSDFPPDLFVSVALFPDSHTLENGCLQFPEEWDGSKRIVLSETHLPENCDVDWKKITTTSKDILFFNSYVPHFSKENNTDSSRRTIFLTFNNYSFGKLYNQYFVKKREVFPPDNELDPNKTYDMDSKYNLANPFLLRRV